MITREMSVKFFSEQDHLSLKLNLVKELMEKVFRKVMVTQGPEGLVEISEA